VGADCVPKISPNTSASPAETTKRTCMQRNQRQLDNETHLHATQSAAIRRSSVTVGGNLATGGAPILTKRTPLSQPSRT
jgi:hypothetical protein